MRGPFLRPPHLKLGRDGGFRWQRLLRFTPSPSADEGIAGHEVVASRRGPTYRAEVPVQGAYGRGLPSLAVKEQSSRIAMAFALMSIG